MASQLENGLCCIKHCWSTYEQNSIVNRSMSWHVCDWTAEWAIIDVRRIHRIWNLGQQANIFELWNFNKTHCTCGHGKSMTKKRGLLVIAAKIIFNWSTVVGSGHKENHMNLYCCQLDVNCMIEARQIDISYAFWKTHQRRKWEQFKNFRPQGQHG